MDRDILEKKYKKLKTFYDTSDNGFWEFNLDIGKVCLSPQYFAILGYESDENPKDINAWIELIHPEDRKRIIIDPESIAEKKVPYSDEFRMLQSDGTWKWILGTLKVCEKDERGIAHKVMGTVIDITDLKRKEKLLEKNLSFEKVISYISSYLLDKTITKEAIDATLKKLGTFLKANRAYVFLHNEDDSLIGDSYEWRAEGVKSEIRSLLTDLFPLWKAKMSNGKIINIKNLSNLTEKERKLLKIRGTKSFIALPLYLNKKSSGFIGFDYTDDSKKWSGDDIKLLKVASRIIGNFFEKKEALERTNHLNRTLKAIRNVNQMIVKEKDRDRLIKKVCDSLVETRGFNNAWIVLLDENGKYLTSAQAGLDEKFIPLEKMMKKGSFTKCGRKTLNSRGIIITENPKISCSDCPLSVNYEGKSSFSIRLHYENRVFGLLTVSIPKIYGKDPEEISLFKEVAGDISFALYNFQLERDKKLADIALVESEKKFQSKIKELLSREEIIENIELSDIIDIKATQSLFKYLYNSLNIISAVLDTEGKVLISVGWQEICTKFHRVNSESRKNCLESDTVLSRGVKNGKYKCYKCKNNLFDFVTPIFIGKKHLGNLFYGQILCEDEKIDYEVFREQARRYGYDEEEYIKALEKVPRRSKAFIENVMKFFAEFADMIANLGYTNLRFAKALQENKTIQAKLRESRFSLIKTISMLLNTRDSYTRFHQERVSKLAVEIAKMMRMPSYSVDCIRTAGLVLDIGKMNVPSDILNKSSKLTEIEFELIKEHVNMGYEILENISFEYPVAGIVLQHHERMDGSGYPNNLKGEEISTEARILAVADVVEAMTSHRPYRPAHSIDEALEYILHNSNKLFDPEVVYTCLELFNEGFSF
ncbi:MAG: hypothetical protein PWQ77_2159 [Kosmotogales bacterium]|nr:hypothetical protein [Kosmotogales bacterium]